MNVHVSVIVPVWNAPDLTERTLRTLAEHHTFRNPCKAEVIIIDNGSDAPTKAVLDAIDYLPAKILTNPTNRGFPTACNQGARVARGEVLVFLNSDVVSEGPWLQTLYSEAVHKNVGQAGPEVVWWPGGDGFGDRRTPYVNGWCMGIRRSVWNWIGGFDEAYSPAYSEDRDLGYRLYIAGLDLRRVPLPVRHMGNGTVNANEFAGATAQDHGHRVWHGKWGLQPHRKICLIRCWAVGDVVMATAAAMGARRRWPNATLGFATLPPMIPLVAGSPFVDDGQLLIEGGGAEQALAEEGRWDLVVQLQDLRPNQHLPEHERADNNHPDGQLPLYKVAKGAKRLWWEVIDDEPLGVKDLTSTNPEWHVVETFCRAIGEGCQPWFAYAHVDEDARAKILERLRPHSRPYIVVAPTGGWKSKQWPADAATAILARLARRRIASVFAVGMEEQYELPEGVIDLRRRTPLPELLALLEVADCVLTPDSGIGHMASAVNTPLVTHWGPTRPCNYHSVGRGPVWNLRSCAPCHPCNRPECRVMGKHGRMPCIQDIDPEQVVDLVREAMGHGPSQPREWTTGLRTPAGEQTREGGAVL